MDPDSVRRLAAHPRCRLVALTWMPTNSGLVQEPRRWARSARPPGVPYLVDACQAVGQLPIDLGAAALRLPGGHGPQVPARAARASASSTSPTAPWRAGDYPLGLDMRGGGGAARTRFELADGARRFENWEFPYALVLGLGEAARYALEVGVERGRAAAVELAAHARERLGAPCRECGSRTAGGGSAPSPPRRSSAGTPPASSIGCARRINTSAATTARPGSPLPVALRSLPHYYNTQEEVDAPWMRSQGSRCRRGDGDDARRRRWSGCDGSRARRWSPSVSGSRPEAREEPMPGQALLTGRMLDRGDPHGATGGASPRRRRARG